MKTITVGITGASGSIYAQSLLTHLNDNPEVGRIDLVISQAGIRVVGEELGLKIAGTDPRVVRELLGKDSDKVIVHSASDIGASIASGSYLSDAMVIVPCSMSTLAAIASGLTLPGLVPALSTPNRSPASWRNSPSAIWLRAELPV